MADVYLSYARADRPLAERVESALRARGLDVWSDANLVTGESWDRVIGRELDAAKAVVVLFTEHSVQSRLLREEASVAQSQSKLIPVIFQGVDAPLAFRGASAINGDAPDYLDRIYADVERLMGRSQPHASARPMEHSRPGETPGGAPSPISVGVVALRTLRTQTFYWFGIGGAVVTLAGNLDAFVVLANWLNWINLHWSVLITWFWNLVIPFDIHVLAEDAVIMTLVAVLFINLVLTSTYRDRSIAIHRLDVILLVTALALTAYIGFSGFVYELDTNQNGIVDDLMGPIMAGVHSILPRSLEALASFSLMTVLGTILTSVLYLPIAVGFSVRPNIPAFAARLWRILLGLLIITALNQLSLWIEAYDWSTVAN